MNRTRAIAIGAFSGVIILLLVVIVWVEALNSSHTVNVWMVTQDVTAGQPFSRANVESVQVKGEPGDFSYTTDNPDASQVFSHRMNAKDIVRNDDIVPAANVAQIPISPAENALGGLRFGLTAVDGGEIVKNGWE